MAKDLCGDERCGHQSPPLPPRDKDPELVARYRLEGKFVAGYIGTHGIAHALNTILDAAKTLKDWVDGDRFRFILLGDGANKTGLDKRTRAEGLNNVIFVEHACQG